MGIHHRIRLLVGTGAVGRSALREFSDKSSEPVRVPDLSKGKVCGARSTERSCYGLTNFFPQPSALLREEKL